MLAQRLLNLFVSIPVPRWQSYVRYMFYTDAGRSTRKKDITKNFAEAVAAAVPEVVRGKPLEVWFQE
jgi:hypothetical protein